MDLQRDYDDLFRAHEDLKLQFIDTELDLAITFCQIALSAAEPDKAERNVTNAYRAYEGAVQWLNGTNAQHNHEIGEKMRRVEELLADLAKEPNARHPRTGRGEIG